MPFLFIIALLVPAPLVALEPGESLADPVLEERARSLSRNIRCLVCQNESIDESQAPLARDLRLLVRQKIQQGDSDDDILLWLRARYGDFVVFTPPWQPSTYALWLVPMLVFAVGSFIIARFFWKQR
ncbi:MAG: cytochrome c-type biogenesis protein CcmH [Alphaproteobacteria bacterium GM202ARS2]|nr:cytochrome c-type biogenesis protein CcmH [Alphaproteobacteria bacterium GM202ARS2]